VLSAGIGATRDRHFLKGGSSRQPCRAPHRLDDIGLRHDGGRAVALRDGQGGESEEAPAQTEAPHTSPLEWLRSKGVHPKPWPSVTSLNDIRMVSTRTMAHHRPIRAPGAFLSRPCSGTVIEREYLASNGGVHAETPCGAGTCRCDIGDFRELTPFGSCDDRWRPA
jgi:hypothetical protein